MHTRTQEKVAVTQQETYLDFPMCVQESPAEAWVGSGPAESGALSVVVHARDLLKEVTIFFIISIIVWPQVKQQGRNTAPPINIKLD